MWFRVSEGGRSYAVRYALRGRREDVEVVKNGGRYDDVVWLEVVLKRRIAITVATLP
jgi:hypothetical protein